MSKRDNLLLLTDIIEAIVHIEGFIEGLSEYEFYNDDKTKYAVVRCLEIIGEASNQVTKDFKSIHGHIEWLQVIGLRNKIIHEYKGVDYVMLWNLIQSDIPAFKQQIQQLIEAHES